MGDYPQGEEVTLIILVASAVKKTVASLNSRASPQVQRYRLAAALPAAWANLRCDGGRLSLKEMRIDGTPEP